MISLPSILWNAPSPIDLNQATQTQLELIPGIGPATASRIILERNRRGGFRTVNDLLKIRGIGRKTLRKIEKYLIIERNNLPDVKPEVVDQEVTTGKYQPFKRRSL
ncbi:helix-hairpin-helix domain-containing protein [bacterium]|nr:helix-hairpin-helix domain-containing protein [candidate division CSSED10-310 bacterium]